MTKNLRGWLLAASSTLRADSKTGEDLRLKLENLLHSARFNSPGWWTLLWGTVTGGISFEDWKKVIAVLAVCRNDLTPHLDTIHGASTLAELSQQSPELLSWHISAIGASVYEREICKELQAIITFASSTSTPQNRLSLHFLEKFVMRSHRDGMVKEATRTCKMEMKNIKEKVKTGRKQAKNKAEEKAIKKEYEAKKKALKQKCNQQKNVAKKEYQEKMKKWKVQARKLQREVKEAKLQKTAR